MGKGDGDIFRIMTDEGRPPEKDEFEITLFGPGYGEGIVLHVGSGVWIIVDSCVDSDNVPKALLYLKNIGLNPACVVKLIVATHWHDDHIRGMAQLVESCDQAAFCCAAALCRREFLAIVGALGSQHRGSVIGSGVRELREVYTRLRQTGIKPTSAIADRRVFRHGKCEVWSLSPDDDTYQNFLAAIGGLLPTAGSTKTRLPDLSPNKAAVALWIKVGSVAALLGSDLERPGWQKILRSMNRPTGRASAYKIPHHGSKDADVQNVWAQLLDIDPVVVLTPWRRGRNALPGQHDVARILSNTKNAYASAKHDNKVVHAYANRTVEEIIRDSNIVFRNPMMSSGVVRLRRCINTSSPWRVELFGAACHLRDFA